MKQGVTTERRGGEGGLEAIDKSEGEDSLVEQNVAFTLLLAGECSAGS